MVNFIAFLILFVTYLERIVSFLVLVRVILTWFPRMHANFFTRFVVDTTQPLFQLVYRFIPSLRTMAIDFSPIIVFLGVQLLRDLVVSVLLRLV